VKLPVTDDYYFEAQKLIPVDSLYLGLSQTIAPFAQQVQVLDNQQLFFGKDHYFCDPHHINLEGKKVFSAWFRRQLSAQ
jgi:hypothetical protein